MLALLSTLALAAGTAPEDRLELQGDVGIITQQAAMVVGLGGGVRQGAFTVIGSAGFGARGDWFDVGVSRRPGFGTGTLQLGLDALAGSNRVGGAVLVDAVLIDAVEEGCGAGGRGREGCRHGWFWGSDEGLAMGVGVQPAYGMRIAGPGLAGAGFVTFIGVQPSYKFDALFWYTPRFDVAVYGRTSDWSLHTWCGRYGVGVGVGRRLSAPRR